MKPSKNVLVKFKLGKKYGCFRMNLKDFLPLLSALGLKPRKKLNIWYPHQVGMLYFQYCITSGYSTYFNSFWNYSEYLLTLYRNEYNIVVHLSHPRKSIPMEFGLDDLKTYLWKDCQKCFTNFAEVYTRS